MGAVRHRRGRRSEWLADYRLAGKRIRRCFHTREEAERAVARADLLSGKRDGPAGALLASTLSAYSGEWLRRAQGRLAPKTLRSYEQLLRVHVLPALGHRPLRELTRASLRELLAQKVEAKLSRNTVRLIHAAVRALLSEAVDEEILIANPAAGLGRVYGLASRRARQHELRALTAEETGQLLRALTARRSVHHVLFEVLLGTGMRVGEVLALRWEDLDLEQRRIRILRGVHEGEEGPTKTGRGRTVLISAGLVQALRRHRMSARQRARRRWNRTGLVFPSPGPAGGYLDAGSVRRAFKRALGWAELPTHFRVHDLRHTYAVLLLRSGVRLQDVRAQLGHSTITLTADQYGQYECPDATGSLSGLDLIFPTELREPAAAGYRKVQKFPARRGRVRS